MSTLADQMGAALDEALAPLTETIRRRSVHSIARAVLIGHEVSAEELRQLARHVAGPRHLQWESGAACGKTARSFPFLTDTMSEVECGACKRSTVFKLAVALRDGAVKP